MNVNIGNTMRNHLDYLNLSGVRVKQDIGQSSRREHTILGLETGQDGYAWNDGIMAVFTPDGGVWVKRVPRHLVDNDLARVRRGLELDHPLPSLETPSWLYPRTTSVDLYELLEKIGE